MSKPLTPKQELFIQHYVTTKNATEAAKLAGYSEKTADVIGCENLVKPNIKEAIDKLLAKELGEVEVDRKWAFENLKRMMQGAEDAGQFSASKGVMDTILKMYGLNEAEKIEHSGSIMGFKIALDD